MMILVLLPLVATIVYILGRRRTYRFAIGFDIITTILYILTALIILFTSSIQMSISSSGIFLGLGIDLYLDFGRLIVLIFGALIYLLSQILPSDGENNWIFPGILLFFTLTVLSTSHFFTLFSISAILFLTLMSVFQYLMGDRGEELYRTTLAFAGLMLSLVFGFAILSARGMGSGSGVLPAVESKTVALGFIFSLIGCLGLAGGSPFNSWFSLIRKSISIRLSIVISNLLYLIGGMIIIRLSDSVTAGEGLIGGFVFASISLLGGAGSALTETDRYKYIRAIRGALIGVIALISLTGHQSSMVTAYTLLITTSLVMTMIEYLLFYKNRSSFVLKWLLFLSISSVPFFAGYNAYVTGFGNIYGLSGWRSYPLTIILMLGLSLLMGALLRLNLGEHETLKEDNRLWWLFIPVVVILIIPYLPFGYGSLFAGLKWSINSIVPSFNLIIKSVLPIIFSLVSLVFGVVLFITLRGETGFLYKERSFFNSIPVIHWLYELKEMKVFSLEIYIKPATKAVAYAMFFIGHILGDPQRFLNNLLKWLISPVHHFIQKEKR